MDLYQSTAWTLVAALATVLMGIRINRYFPLLERSNIPPAVTAGVLLSMLVAILHHAGVADLRLDPAPRDWLLLLFFATLGLSARLGRLAVAGRGVLILCGAVALLAVTQNLAGVALAWGLGEPPALGLFAGSAAYLGGHGTATAWAATPQVASLNGALEVGLGSATLGLVLGALFAGPVASRLASRAQSTVQRREQAAPSPQEDVPVTPLDAERWLGPLLAILFCVVAGFPLREVMAAIGLPIPGFLAVLLSAVALTNLADKFGRPVNTQLTDLLGAIALNLFLAIAMLTLDWAALANRLPLLLTGAMVQVVVTCAVAVIVVFPLFGRDKDAAAACGGFIGVGLGAMPVGLAVIRRLNQNLGATPRALLAITLAASLFTDAANSLILLVFLRLTG